MKKFANIALVLLAFFLTLVVSLCIIYKVGISSVDKKDNKIILVEIKEGNSTKEIAQKLKKNDVIKNDLIFQIYLKLNNINDLKAGYFELKKSMSVEEIVDKISKGDSVNPNQITVLFKEGLNMRGIAKVIAENTNNTEEDVFNTLEDSNYINELINKYWFLTDEIKNVDVYYPLEGYLYPNTYTFLDKNISVKEIFTTLLDETDKLLTKYKDEIENSKYSVHQLLTLASMSELEGVSLEDRKNIVGVFINRLNKNMTLGSDVTTYYAFKVDMGERDLKNSEINSYNAYNTRGPNMNGKLPIGPISNPSKEAIISAIEPANNDYLYFVADKNRKVYFTKTSAEHDKKVAELKSQGLWYQW